MAIQEYWLTQKCYMQQAGQTVPRFIDASMGNPVKVRLNDTVIRGGKEEPLKTGRFLSLIKPDKPVDVRPGRPEAPDMNLAQPSEGRRGRGRAADQ